jgi:hypothetical protein
VKKISDCFATGPYQYGTDMIGDVFNMDGIIMLNENFNINDLTPELYYNKIDAIINTTGLSICQLLKITYLKII